MNLRYPDNVITMSHHMDGMPNDLLGAMNDQSMVDLVIIGMNTIVGNLTNRLITL